MGLQRRREFDPGGEVLSELSNGIDELGPESFSTPRIHHRFVTVCLQAVYSPQFMYLLYIAYYVSVFRRRMSRSSDPNPSNARRVACSGQSVSDTLSLSNIRVALSP